MTQLFNVLVLNDELRKVTLIDRTWNQVVDIHNCGRYTILNVESCGYTQESVRRALGIDK